MIGLCLAISAAVLLQSGDPAAPIAAAAPAITQVELPAESFRRSVDGFARVKPSRFTLLQCDAPPKSVTPIDGLDLPEARTVAEPKAVWIEGRPKDGKWQRLGGLRWDSSEVVWQWDGFFENAMRPAVVAVDRWLALLVIDVEASNGAHFELARATAPVTISVSRNKEGSVSLVPLPDDARLSLYRGGEWNEVENDGQRMTLAAPDAADLTITLDLTAQSLKVGLASAGDQGVRELLRELEQVKRFLKTAPEDMAETYRMQQTQLEEQIKTARATAAAAAPKILPEGPVLRVTAGKSERVCFEVTVKLLKAGGS